ncbi:MAG TPA: DoxX family protein [Pirellulaceae bacterium]
MAHFTIEQRQYTIDSQSSSEPEFPAFACASQETAMLPGISPSVLRDLGLLLIRVMLGCIFAFHGAQKLLGWWDGPGLGQFAVFLNGLEIPYPAYGAVLAGAAELFGGIALITGFWMRTLSVPLLATMGTAIWFVHRHEFDLAKGGMEYPLTLAVTTLGLALTGPGTFALTHIPGLAWLSTWRGERQLDISSEPSFGGSATHPEAQPAIRAIRTLAR